MAAMSSTLARLPRDKLKSMVWSHALSYDGSLVMPTVDRVTAVRTLVARWIAEDRQLGSDESLDS